MVEDESDSDNELFSTDGKTKTFQETQKMERYGFKIKFRKKVGQVVIEEFRLGSYLISSHTVAR